MVCAPATGRVGLAAPAPSVFGTARPASPSCAAKLFDDSSRLAHRNAPSHAESRAWRRRVAHDAPRPPPPDGDGAAADGRGRCPCARRCAPTVMSGGSEHDERRAGSALRRDFSYERRAPSPARRAPEEAAFEVRRKPSASPKGANAPAGPREPGGAPRATRQRPRRHGNSLLISKWRTVVPKE